MKLKPYYTALRRYHRSKGYGIHSPFAFNFTVKVLHERCAYYAYSDIDRWRQKTIKLAKGRWRHPRIISAKHARLLLRIACYFRPRAIMLIGNTYGMSAMSMLRADSRTPLIIYPGAQQHDDIFSHITDCYNSSITLVPALDAAIGCYSTAIGDNNAPFIVVSLISDSERDTVERLLIDAINRGGTVIVRNITRSRIIADVWQHINSTIGHGMTFSNERMGIIVGYTHLPRQSFSLWF